MASGHEYRARRPNTWPHRPRLLSEDSTCQPGAVHTWPFSAIRLNLASALRKEAALAPSPSWPSVWSGRALQEVSSIRQVWSYISVSLDGARSAPGHRNGAAPIQDMPEAPDFVLGALDKMAILAVRVGDLLSGYDAPAWLGAARTRRRRS
jgi:hypothetical protein